MNPLDQQTERREFLKHAVKTAAGTAFVCGTSSNSASESQDTGNSQASGLPVRKLGKTGEPLPILGYGGAALPKAWHNPLSYQARIELVRHAFERGIRYYDTAGNYMESEVILGEALAPVRDKVFLTTKVETTKPSKVRAAVERSLEKLQTTYLDSILIHGTPGIQQMTFKESMKIHSELDKLRDEKITRFIGFSAHGYFDKALALIDTEGFDLCMLSYGYIPRGYDQIWSARQTTLRDACLSRADALNMGIVAMKVIGAGMLGAWSGYIMPDYDKRLLKKMPAAAIRHVLQDSRVHMLTIGMRLSEEIDRNIQILTGRTEYTSEDRALLAEYSAKLYDSEAIKKLRVER